MKLILAAREDIVAQAFERHCNDLPYIEVRRQLPFDVACDAVVSPGNSFGFMGRGVDLLYLQRFGNELEERLRRVIRTHHHGELLVGGAAILATDDPVIPYLIAAPSMRSPNAAHAGLDMYLSLRAVLLLWTYGVFSDGQNDGRQVSEIVKTVVFTVPELDDRPDLHARQMRAALDTTLGTNLTFPETYQDACIHHESLWAVRGDCAVAEIESQTPLD